MNRYAFKPILIGLLLGVALFIIPFFVAKAIVFFLIVGALFRYVKRRRIRKGNAHELHPAVADVIRHMSEQEYTIYRQKLEEHYYGNSHKKVQVIEIQ
jgi:hypothetical protein